MPWIKKDSRPRNPYWLPAIIAGSALVVGIFIGYTRWGATAAIVDLVEKELAQTEAHIKVLEKRMTAIETLILGEEAQGGPRAEGSGAAKNSEAQASKNHLKKLREKQVWNESRL